jgi:hypothetical protein
MNDDEYEDFKQYQLNIKGLDCLDEQMLGALIDSLVDYYASKFGLDMTLCHFTTPDEPEKPVYDAENLDVAKDYLKKFRLNG